MKVHSFSYLMSHSYIHIYRYVYSDRIVDQSQNIHVINIVEISRLIQIWPRQNDELIAIYIF